MPTKISASTSYMDLLHFLVQRTQLHAKAFPISRSSPSGHDSDSEAFLDLASFLNHH